MKTNRLIYFYCITMWGICATLIFVTGCQRRPQSSDSKSNLKLATRNTVHTTNLVLACFARHIGGEFVQVEYRVPSDVDPAFWRPTPDDIHAMQQAELILINGATYEKWLPSVTLPQSKLVDTSESFWKDFIKIPDAVVHRHGPTGKHSHSGIAFTTWLDFEQANKQAQAIRDAFVDRWPKHRESFVDGYKTLDRKLVDFDQRCMRISKKIADEPVVVSHPVYQYWARKYKVTCLELHWATEKTINDQAKQELADLIGEEKVRLFLWEDNPSPDSVERLAQIGLTSIIFPPMANGEDPTIWLEQMDQALSRFESILDSLPVLGQ